MFNPYTGQPIPNYPQPSYNPQSFNRTEVTKVSGRNGAEAFQLGPNSSVLLLDETAPLVWLKTTDGAGYPTLTPYNITPYQPKPVIDVENLAERIKKLEDRLNAKSNSSEPKHQPASSNAK